MARATVPWTTEEESLLRKMPDAPPGRIQNTFQEMRKKKARGFTTDRSTSAIRHKRTSMIEEQDIQIQERPSFPDRLKSIQEIQKNHYSGIAKGQENYSQKGPWTKILAFSDLHFPFTRLDMVEQGMTEHKDAKILVLNGDIIEGYAFSSYEKSRLIYAVDEYRCMFNFVKVALEVFPKIVLVEGNHEDRIARYLQRQGVGQSQSTLLKPSVMTRIANGEEIDAQGNTIELHKSFRERVSFRQKEPWWTLVGKTLFVHPSNKISSDPGFTVTRWDKAFSQRLAIGSYDSMVVGHTHCIYKGVQHGRLLIEQGCGSGFMDYEWDRRGASLMKAQNGYAVIYQDAEGNTDFNRSGVQYYGYVQPALPSSN